MAKKRNTNTKEMILDTVEKLVSSEGINDFTLRDVTHALSISKGTLYYFYTSKDQILMDIMFRHMVQLQEEYLAWLDRHKTDLTQDRFLEVVFYKGVKLFNRAKMHVFVVNECIGGNIELRQRFSDMYRTWRNNLKIGVQQVFPKAEDSEALSYVILLIIDGLVVQEVLQLDELPSEKTISLVERMGR